MRKASIFILSFALIWSVFAPQPAFAAEGAADIEAQPEATAVNIVAEAIVYSDEDPTEPLGTIADNTILQVKRVDDGKVYIQWDRDVAYIEETKVEPVEGPLAEDLFSEAMTQAGSFKVIEDSEVLAADGTLLATLAAGTHYAYIALDNGQYEIRLANRTGYVVQSQSIEIVEGETASPEAPQQHDEAEETAADSGTIVQEETPLTNERTISTLAINTKASAFDKYFQVNEDNLTVYDNRTGKLVPIGTLTKGQHYPRVSDYVNWHRIQFGDRYGYVRKASTVPSTGSTIKNLNENYKNSNDTFVALTDVTVYDNTSGKLVPFATIAQGQKYPIVSDYGNWYRIDVSGRIGYVSKSQVKVDFKKSDKYFIVLQEDVPVYDNRTGELIQVGTLTKGQVYPRVRDYGNWHEIRFGNRFGYVSKSSTAPASGGSLKNINKGLKNSDTIFETLSNVTVYDNTSGSLVPFATIAQGQKHPVVSDYGNWYRIDVSGRIGYVSKSQVEVDFKKSDKYFIVLQDDVPVYDNRTGQLVQVGTLTKGQVYPRVRDYGNWHEIRFGDHFGYVSKSSTAPATGGSLKNINKTYKNSNTFFEPLSDLTVYDNTSGSLVPFATLLKGKEYPLVNDYGNWYRVLVSDRIGFVHKSNVSVVSQTEIKYVQYNRTLAEMLNIQINATPRTDSRPGAGYVSRDYIVNGKVSLSNPSSSLNVRSKPNGSIIGSLRHGNTVKILSTNGNWYEIEYDSGETWQIAKSKDVMYYLNPHNNDMFQHLVLTGSAGASDSQLNKLLSGKGVLAGKGQAFINASKTHGVNEVYLISHALLETGNGSSTLARGVKVGRNKSGNAVIVTAQNRSQLTNIKKVYNMYGIGAYDSNPLAGGATYAYNAGWDSIDKAIVGGAAFISSSYFKRGQNTLYKMRWNPDNPGTYQYATDIGWAVKQISRIKNLYDQISGYRLKFEIPLYK